MCSLVAPQSASMRSHTRMQSCSRRCQRSWQAQIGRDSRNSPLRRDAVATQPFVLNSRCKPSTHTHHTHTHACRHANMCADMTCVVPLLLQTRIDAENLALLTRLRTKRTNYSADKMRQAMHCCVNECKAPHFPVTHHPTHQDWAVNRERFDRLCQNPGGLVKQPHTARARASPRELPSLETVQHTPRPPPPQTARPPPSTRPLRGGRRRPAPGGTATAHLDAIQLDELQLLLSIERPTEILEKVFAALLILVSPYEPNEVDCSWVALREWVGALKGTKQFLSNLRAFNPLTVLSRNVEACVGFLNNEQEMNLLRMAWDA